MSEDQKSGKSLFNYRQVLYQLLYQGVFIINKTIELIQSKNLRETLCDIKKKFVKIEKKGSWLYSPKH